MRENKVGTGIKSGKSYERLTGSRVVLESEPIRDTGCNGVNVLESASEFDTDWVVYGVATEPGLVEDMRCTVGM